MLSRICLVIFVCITQNHGYEIRELHRVNKDPLVFKLIERNNVILLVKAKNDEAKSLVRNLKRNNEDIRYNNDIINNLNKANENAGLNKILIKRLVPKNYETPAIEYDHKHNTYFRPLVRLQNGERNDFDDDSQIRYDIDSNEGMKKINDFNNIKFYDESNEMKDDDDLSLSIPLDAYLKQQPADKFALYEVNTISDVINNLKKAGVDIKTQEDKSKMLTALLHLLDNNRGQMVYSLRNQESLSKDPATELNAVEVEINPNPPAIYTPFYNYWTYKKTIYEDECKGDKVKIGNVCSRLPPHRRHLYAP